MVRDKRCWPACPACWKAYQKFNSRAAYRRDAGLTVKKVSADKATAMVEEMLDEYGRTLRWICATAGLDSRTLTALKAGTRKTVLATTADGIAYAYDCAVERGPVDAKMHVNLADSTLPMNAVRGMMQQGWTQEWIAHKIGVDHKTISTISRGVQKHVMRETADSLVYLAKQLGSRQGPSVYARAQGTRRGWQPTMAHDALV